MERKKEISFLLPLSLPTCHLVTTGGADGLVVTNGAFHDGDGGLVTTVGGVADR